MTKTLLVTYVLAACTSVVQADDQDKKGSSCETLIDLPITNSRPQTFAKANLVDHVFCQLGLELDPTTQVVLNTLSSEDEKNATKVGATLTALKITQKKLAQQEGAEAEEDNGGVSVYTKVDGAKYTWWKQKGPRSTAKDFLNEFPPLDAEDKVALEFQAPNLKSVAAQKIKGLFARAGAKETGEEEALRRRRDEACERVMGISYGLDGEVAWTEGIYDMTDLEAPERTSAETILHDRQENKNQPSDDDKWKCMLETHERKLSEEKNVAPKKPLVGANRETAMACMAGLGHARFKFADVGKVQQRAKDKRARQAAKLAAEVDQQVVEVPTQEKAAIDGRHESAIPRASDINVAQTQVQPSAEQLLEDNDKPVATKPLIAADKDTAWACLEGLGYAMSSGTDIFGTKSRKLRYMKLKGQRERAALAKAEASQTQEQAALTEVGKVEGSAATHACTDEVNISEEGVPRHEEANAPQTQSLQEAEQSRSCSEDIKCTETSSPVELEPVAETVTVHPGSSSERPLLLANPRHHAVSSSELRPPAADVPREPHRSRRPLLLTVDQVADVAQRVMTNMVISRIQSHVFLPMLLFN